jgi:hypothetical protein
MTFTVLHYITCDHLKLSKRLHQYYIFTICKLHELSVNLMCNSYNDIIYVSNFKAFCYITNEDVLAAKNFFLKKNHILDFQNGL